MLSNLLGYKIDDPIPNLSVFNSTTSSMDENVNKISEAARHVAKFLINSFGSMLAM